MYFGTNKYILKNQEVNCNASRAIPYEETMLCNTCMNGCAEVVKDCLLTPWFPLNLMNGCCDRICNKETEISLGFILTC